MLLGWTRQVARADSQRQSLG